MHGHTISDLGLILQAGLGVLARLLHREVMPAVHGTQAHERNAELAVAKLPAVRRVRLIILVDGAAQLDTTGLERDQQRFQVVNVILDLDLAHHASVSAWVS